jgi:hypothetical protein
VPLQTANKREHVLQFLRFALQPNPEACTSLRKLQARYLDWCVSSSIGPLPPSELGPELRSIVDAIGLECRSTWKDVIVQGAAIDLHFMQADIVNLDGGTNHVEYLRPLCDEHIRLVKLLNNLFRLVVFLSDARPTRPCRRT